MSSVFLIPARAGQHPPWVEVRGTQGDIKIVGDDPLIGQIKKDLEV